MRMIIASNTVCRADPNSTSAMVHAYDIGDLIAVANESTEGGASWYFDQWKVSGRSPTCWVYGPLTVAWDQSNEEPALLAALRHVLDEGNAAGFEDDVEVENLLIHYSSVVMSSGLLQFQHLNLIAQAVSLESGRSLDRQPLKKAWVLSHRDVVFYFDPDDRWYIRPQPYWTLFEKYKQASWAEDVAWRAANVTMPSDECYANCILNQVEETYMQYWTRYPDGTKVDEALAKAAPMAKAAADIACQDKRETDYSVPRSLLEELRNSLVNVQAPGKQAFLQYLEETERKCYSQ